MTLMNSTSLVRFQNRAKKLARSRKPRVRRKSNLRGTTQIRVAEEAVETDLRVDGIHPINLVPAVQVARVVPETNDVARIDQKSPNINWFFRQIEVPEV